LRGVLREGLQIFYLEGQVGDVVADLDLAAAVELANLDLLLAARRLEENEVRAARRGMAAGQFEPEDVAIEGHGLFESLTR